MNAFSSKKKSPTLDTSSQAETLLGFEVTVVLPKDLKNFFGNLDGRL